jgi:thiol-disulfide isomerase/thioredoxin
MAKTGVIVLMLAALAAAPAGSGLAKAGGQAGPFEVGATIPADVRMTDIHGKEHSLGDLRGKVVFIHFWSIVCPYMKTSEPKCKELQNDFGDKGVVQIAINANQKELAGDGGAQYENLRAAAEQRGLNFTVAVDPGNKLTDIFDAKTTPHSYVIDKEGVLRYAGALDDDPKGDKGDQRTPYVRNAIEAVLAGNPVEVTTSKPYG